MKKIKKIRKAAFFLVTLGVLNLCGCSGGDATSSAPNTQENVLLAEALKVPEHYIFQDQSSSGKCKVKVNADIIVPEVYPHQVKVYEGVPVAFTEEQIHGFLEHMGGFQWKDGDTELPYDNMGFHKRFAQFGTDDTTVMHSLYMTASGNDLKHTLRVQFGLEARTGNISYPPALEYWNNKGNAYLGMITSFDLSNKTKEFTDSFEKAVAFANDEAAYFSPDFTLAQYGQMYRHSWDDADDISPVLWIPIYSQH